jgi:hypothetical protein
MKTIAFFFENNDTWVGEKNYLISLITSISKNKSISLKIFCSKKDIKFLKKKKLAQNI